MRLPRSSHRTRALPEFHWRASARLLLARPRAWGLKLSDSDCHHCVLFVCDMASCVCVSRMFPCVMQHCWGLAVPTLSKKSPCWCMFACLLYNRIPQVPLVIYCWSLHTHIQSTAVSSWGLGCGNVPLQTAEVEARGGCSSTHSTSGAPSTEWTMNSRRSCKSPLWRFAVIVLVQALSPAPAAEATGGPCDSQAWADTKCCRGK